METLILSRMRDGLHPTTPTPFNHTCMNSKWSLNKNVFKRFPQAELDRLAASPPEWDWVRYRENIDILHTSCACPIHVINALRRGDLSRDVTAVLRGAAISDTRIQ